MNDKLYTESIILIGPSGAGKSTIAEELSRKLNIPRLCLDRIANRARQTGFTRKFKNADEFNSFMISEVIKKAKQDNIPGVVDFGAGHSVYDDNEIFEIVRNQLKPFKNIVLLLPSRDETLSLNIMANRSTGDTRDNLKFLRSSCNRELATMTIYGNDRTPSDIASEIISRIKEREEKSNDQEVGEEIANGVSIVEVDESEVETEIRMENIKDGKIEMQNGQQVPKETAELSQAKKIIARRLEGGRTTESENEYRQMVTNEPSGVILELVTNINQLSQQYREMALQIKTKSEQGENVDDLTEQKRDLHKMYSSYVDILTDFILKHQTDSKYIDDILEQMPFLDRANFINHSQKNMTSKGVYGGKHVEITNVRDVFERNIDREVRKRLRSQSFEEVAGELYNAVESVGHPLPTRRPGPKYNCINFALYRIDEELGKGLYEKELSKLNFGGKTERERIASAYGYGRDIYEQHLPPQTSEMDSYCRGRYVDTLYWAQKITTEDKVRLGLSEINGVTAEMRKDLTQQKETTLSFGL